MSSYGGKRTYNNYHYSHNQLSADNPFRFIGITYNPYQPKVSSQPYPQYETKTAAQLSKRRDQPISPYERKSYYNNLDNNDNKPWSKTGSSSSLINNSYNIINNIPYSKNQNTNYGLMQQRDHVGELFNANNRDYQNYYSGNNTNKKQQNINSNNNDNIENINPTSFNGYATLKPAKTSQKNIFENKNRNIEVNNNNNNNNNNYYSNNNNYRKNKLFSSPQNYVDLFISTKKFDDIDERNDDYNSNYNNRSFNNEKISNIDLSEYSEENCTAVKSYAYKENPNSRYRDYMEDKGRAIENIKGDPNSCLFCLFDGHGGGDVSKYLQLNFYTYFKEILPFQNFKEHFTSVFKLLDNKIKDLNYCNMGSTACVIYITKENGQRCLYSANIGDTRSLLISSNDYKRLSYDHRATDEVECKRITNSGGIIFAGRVYGQLMLTRAFGDWELKQFGVTCEPHITRINITDNDRYVVVATDGVWDIFEDKDIYQMSKDMNNSKEFCNSIVDKAIEKGSMDNISCFIIKLN